MSQRFALIIGNSEYADPKLPRLATPAEDARALSEVLRDPQIGDFDEVPTLIDESDSTVRKAIERFFAKRKADDLLLLYFSGHGVLDDQGRLYLAVRDTEYDLLSASAVPAAFITDNMDRTQSKRQVLILDCCHSGAFFKGTKAPAETKALTESTFRGRGYGKVVLTATDTTQYAWEHDHLVGDFENSIFTHFLVEGLKTGRADLDKDGEITIDELYDYVYGELLSRTSRQTPHRWSYKQHGKMVIARNLLGRSRPAGLSSELLQTLEDSRPYVREGGVRELGRLLHSYDPEVVHSAETALARIVADDDSRLVSKLASEILDAHQSPIYENKIAPANRDIEEAIASADETKADQSLETVLKSDSGNAEAKSRLSQVQRQRIPSLIVTFLSSLKALLHIRPQLRFDYLRWWTALSMHVRYRRRYYVVASVLLLAIIVGVSSYYWIVFARRIDRLRETALFVPSDGIYASSKSVHVGDETPIQNLIDYLEAAGYIPKSQAPNPRGRYVRGEDSLEVIPSNNQKGATKRVFPHIRIHWSENQKKVTGIEDASNNAELQDALLEPIKIGAVGQQTDEFPRRLVWFQDLPRHLTNALAVMEQHNLGRNRTIPEQIINDLLLTPSQTLGYKLALFSMTLVMKTRLSREEILQIYSNEISLGHFEGKSLRGFGTGAEYYFGKNIQSITLAESAFLVGKIGSPESDFKKATDSAKQILDAMAQAGAITRGDATQASNELSTLALWNRLSVGPGSYFANYVTNQLGDFSAEGDNLRVDTTIDMDLQIAAQSAITKQLSILDKNHASVGSLEAALIAMNPKTGEVLAMVGGRDYSRSQVNHATDVYRPLGSIFKPFVYATALNTAFDPVPRVISPATVYMDEPKTFTFDGGREYSPKGFSVNGPVTLRDAFVRSLNVVTVDVAMEVTLGRVMNLAAKAGLPKPEHIEPAIALGTGGATPLQVTSAYTAFANLGTRSAPQSISQITNSEGIAIAKPTPQKNEVLAPQVAYIMNSFMKDVVNSGTAMKVSERGFKVIAGQTGSSSDGWFAGFTPNLVCVVWVGNDNGSPLNLTSATSALPVWIAFMQLALSKHPEWEGDWQMPEGIQQIAINPVTGERSAKEGSSGRLEYIIKGTSPDLSVEKPRNLAKETPQDSREGPSPTTKSTPPPSSPPREGTITLDIDPTTGFIALESCPTIQTKVFVLGTEPRKYCGPEYHRKLAVGAEGTITLDICPTTGFLAVESCPIIRTKTFILGTEPKRFCGPEFHRKKGSPKSN